MRPFSGIDDKKVDALKDDILQVIEKRRAEYKTPGDPIYTEDAILCALEIVRALVLVDMALIEASNRER